MIMREAYFCSIYHFEGAKSTFKVFFFFSFVKNDVTDRNKTLIYKIL